MSASDPFIVSLDIGSSSIRALLFDSGARQVEGCGAHLPYRIQTTADGGAEADPENLAHMALDCLDEVHRQAHDGGMRIAAVGGSAFWHGLLGTGADGKPTVPLIHLFDTRSTPFADQAPDAHARTGCPRHSSYWPAKLLWLASARPTEYAATRHWMGFPEYLFAKLFGRPRASVSMISATGLWNQRDGEYDREMLAALGLAREQLPNPLEMDLLERELLPEYRRQWPAFEGAAWFPLLGDGALNNVGSGCTGPDSFSLMVGTTGAMRVIVESLPAAIPPGLWAYRLDRGRLVMGGALSNGGEVYSWMKRTLALPKDIEARLDRATPGAHGLGLLPFFAGERTPYWRGDLHGVISGLSFATEPMDILQAGLESVSLGFGQIYDLLSAAIPHPTEIIASGGALLRSPAWTQMMADALGRPVTASTEIEPSARGAAIWAMEQLGLVKGLGQIPASNGAIFGPRPHAQAAFEDLRGRRHTLYKKLFETTW